MNRMKIVITAFALGMFASIGSTVNAEPPVNIDCANVTGGAIQSQLLELCAVTKAPAVFKNERDQDALEAKILGAGTKVDQNKLSDAEKKLRDFETNLLSLMSTCPKKITCAGGSAIQAELNDAFLALDQLQ